MELLQKEDFEDFEIGPFPYDPEHSAMGEYHYYPPEGYRGNWYCPITDYGWRGPMWLIVEQEGIKVMETTKLKRSDTFTWNCLATGSDDWSDYTVQARMRVMNTSLAGGIAFRYQNSRCAYLFYLEKGEAKLVYRHHKDFEELYKENYNYDVDSFYNLKVKCYGTKIKCYIDEELICSVKDTRYSGGKIALYASAVVQYSEVEITTEDKVYQQLLQRRREKKIHLQEKKKMYSQPRLWKRLCLKDFGAGRSLRFGDLTGNGQADILLAQCQKRVYKDAYANISCLTAIDLEGNIIWQKGTPDPENAFITADLPLQIVDIDGNGRNEVVMARNFKIKILDGITGEVIKQIPTPYSIEDGKDLYKVPYSQYAFGRVNIDSIRICNFTGGEQPTDILVKDRYSRLWAYDCDLNLLWKYNDCITGHYPFTKDINEDGREEMFVGYNLVDADGNTIWRLPFETEHTDEIIIGPINPKYKKDVILLASGNQGFLIVDLEGNIIEQKFIGHAQRISAGNYRPDLSGYEIVVTTYWGNQGIIYIFDCEGNLLYSFEPGTNGNIISPVNWTGDGRDLILLNGNVYYGGMINGRGERVVIFPADGHPERCAEVIDITGDSRDEVVLWDEKELWIYTQDKIKEGNLYIPEKYSEYNNSNYRGEFSW